MKGLKPYVLLRVIKDHEAPGPLVQHSVELPVQNHLGEPDEMVKFQPSEPTQKKREWFLLELNSLGGKVDQFCDVTNLDN